MLCCEHAANLCACVLGRPGLFIVESLGGMSGKRSAQYSGNAQGKQPTAKRQSRADAADVLEKSRATLAPVTISFTMRCDARELAARQEALEAALRRVVAEFGGREFRMGRTRVGPSDDTLHRVLPFVVERVGPAAAWRFFRPHSRLDLPSFLPHSAPPNHA